MERYLQLLLEGVENPVALAQRIGVSERTIFRYEKQLGVSRGRRVVRYHEYKPQILAHLQAWPNSRFSAWDLTKVLRLDGVGLVKNALRHLHEEGLVQAIIEPRDPSTPQQLVTRWQIAQAQVEAA
ncbi:hypothetical protein ACFQX6_11440 [Streptosporangium lutulentum]